MATTGYPFGEDFPHISHQNMQEPVFDSSFILEAVITEKHLSDELLRKINGSFCIYSKLLGYCDRCANRLYKEMHSKRCAYERIFELPELVNGEGK